MMRILLLFLIILASLSCLSVVNSFVPLLSYPTRNNKNKNNNNYHCHSHHDVKKSKSCSTRLYYLQSPGGSRYSWQSSVSRHKDSSQAIKELIRHVELPMLDDDSSDDEQQQQYQAVAFLFVSQFHTYNFADIVENVYEGLGGKVLLLSLIGGGVVGGNEEYDESAPVISMLWGVLPPDAMATGFFDGPKQSMSALFPWWPPPLPTKRSRQNSRIVFADPWFDVEESIISNSNNDIVIGGISCPSVFADEIRPTVAINGTALPQGSAAGVSFSGSFGIQAIAAQGCRPVGPIFNITSAEGNTLKELDGVSALTQLERVVSKASIRDKQLMDRHGLLCGVAEKSNNNNNDDQTTAAATTMASTSSSSDLLIRQIKIKALEGNVNSTGIPGLGGGALTLDMKTLREGDQFQFQVRDSATAQEDMEDKMRRAKVERLFAGQNAGLPVAAIQITCGSNGRSLFGSPNVNLNLIRQELLGGGSSGAGGTEKDGNNALSSSSSSQRDNTAVPVGGFFAKGEIGPIGISGFGSSSSSSVSSSSSSSDGGGNGGTYIHTFTTIVGLLCDYSSVSSCEEEDLLSAGDEQPVEIASEEEWG